MVLILVLAAGLVPLALMAYQRAPARGGPPAPSAQAIEVEKLRDNLWVLKGGGGNTAVFVGTNGVVVVDTKNPGWGRPILDKIQGLTNKPITTIINTHTHGDHVSGNVEFPATVEIITHENTKQNMETMKNATGINDPTPPPPATTIFQQNGGKGMPKRTFKDKMSIGNGGDRIDLYYFGRGHTNGDAWVVFPALRVMHAADIFSGKNLPLLDRNNGGSGVAIADTLNKAANTVKNIDTIITGHSNQMTMDDLREYVQFNRDFMMAVQTGKKAGKSVDQVASEWKMPEKYKGYAAAPPVRLKNNVQIIFDETK
jgi:glyoxylase-like metal-dependent hydrolase (beta-lactamase superfamily II)